MKAIKFAVPMVLALLVSAFTYAGEAKEEKFVGKVEKAAKVEKDVVATLKAKVEGKEVTLNLVAKDEVAKQVVALDGKEAVVHGVKTGDNVVVAKIEAKKHHEEKKHDAK